MKQLTIDEVSSSANIMAFWAILVGHFAGQHMICVCCGTLNSADENETILETLRKMGFEETVARAQRESHSSRGYMNVCGAHVLKYLLEDAEKVFSATKPRRSE